MLTPHLWSERICQSQALSDTGGLGCLQATPEGLAGLRGRAPCTHLGRRVVVTQGTHTHCPLGLQGELSHVLP